MFTLRIIIIVTAVIFPLNYQLCLCKCSRTEYKINNRCCPMCASGNHVYWQCTVDTSTTCIPCPEFTFTDESNGLTKCFSCGECISGQGLRVKKACTRSSNTVCEPLEGFYCIDKNKGSCTLAVEHSKCNPGKYIKQAGTASTDTVCDDCTDGTYSNGSFLSCLAHSKCEALGLTEINPGTSSSDTECGKSAIYIIGIIGLVMVTILILALLVNSWRKEQSTSSVSGGEETAEPDSLRLEDNAGQRNPNMENVTVSSPLTNYSSHSGKT